MVNKVILVGRLGRDPEIRYTGQGAACANFSIATSEFRKNNDGKGEEKTEWHRIVAWRKLAESVTANVQKGSLVYLEGKLQTRKWTGRDKAERQTTEVVASIVRVLAGRKERDQGEIFPDNTDFADEEPVGVTITDDDLPF